MKAYTDSDLLECFVRASHYLATTQSSEDVFAKIQDAASVLPEYEWCAFYAWKPPGELVLHGCSQPGGALCQLLEGASCKQTAQQALESSFFELTQDFHGNWIAFFPLMEHSGCQEVLAFGLGCREPSKRKLRFLLAFCGIAGQALGRWHADQELINIQRNLEQAVAERSRKLSEALTRAEQLARNAEATTELKSQFLANMSHELRTPLNGILGMADLLATTEVSQEQREYLDILTCSGQSLLALIRDILDFSKIEAGQLDLHETPFTLPELLDPLEATVRPQLAEHALNFRCFLPLYFQQELLGDVGRIRQILGNLLINAAKFTLHGRVELLTEIEEHPKEPGKYRIVFRVRDTGIGVPPAKQNLLFEKFSQVDVSNTRKFGGTGLGLAICRQLTDLMGGSIGMRSPLREKFPPEEGPGSEFWIELQLERANGRANPGKENTSASPPAQWETAADPGPAGTSSIRPRVLVVEDNEVNQRMLCISLKKLGYDYLTAENGLIALDLLERYKVDIILMDLQMPEMDGLTATRKIRALPAGHPARDLPILAVTARAYVEDRAESLGAGCNEHLVKPVNRTTLKAALDRWARRKGSGSGR